MKTDIQFLEQKIRESTLLMSRQRDLLLQHLLDLTDTQHRQLSDVFALERPPEEGTVSAVVDGILDSIPRLENEAMDELGTTKKADSFSDSWQRCSGTCLVKHYLEHQQYRKRVGDIIDQELGFRTLKFLADGCEAMVLEVPGQSIVLRIAPAHESAYRPNIPEVLQPFESFVLHDLSNHWKPMESIRIEVFPKGKNDVTFREANELARSIECRGWYWRESKPENAVRLADGKAYIADAASLYPVSGYGLPIWSGGQNPQQYSEVYMGAVPLEKVKVSPKMTIVQRAVFAFRQMSVLRSPFQRWSVEGQLMGVPEEFQPGSERWRIVHERRATREKSEKILQARFREQEDIDRVVCDRLVKDMRQKERELLGEEHRSDYRTYEEFADRALAFVIEEAGFDVWVSLHIEDRLVKACARMEEQDDGRIVRHAGFKDLEEAREAIRAFQTDMTATEPIQKKWMALPLKTRAMLGDVIASNGLLKIREVQERLDTLQNERLSEAQLRTLRKEAATVLREWLMQTAIDDATRVHLADVLLRRPLNSEERTALLHPVSHRLCR